MQDGEVRIRVADWRDYPGHMEWLRRDRINEDDVVAGFSMIIKSGLLSGLHPYSRLNSGDPPCLTEDQIRGVESLLPLARNYRVYR